MRHNYHGTGGVCTNAPDRRASTQDLANSSAALRLVREPVQACTGAVRKVARWRIVRVANLHGGAVDVSSGIVRQTFEVCVAANVKVIREGSVGARDKVVSLVVAQSRKVKFPICRKDWVCVDIHTYSRGTA